MNFIFEWQKQRVSKILFLTRENNVLITKPPCNFLFITYIYKSIALSIFYRLECRNNLEKAGNDVINILTKWDMENTPLGSRM